MIDVDLPDTVGGDYLSKLRVKASRERERQTKARALSVQVHKLFNPLEEEVSCKKVAPQGMLIDIAHLIDSKSRGKIPEPLQHGRQAVEELRSRHQRTLAAIPLPSREAAYCGRKQLVSFSSRWFVPAARTYPFRSTHLHRMCRLVHCQPRHSGLRM